MKTLTLEEVIRTFSSIGEAINANLDRQASLQRTLQILIQSLDYQAASVRLLDPERQLLERQASVGLSDEYLQKGPVAVEQSALDRSVLQGEIVAVEDITQDQRWQYPAAAQAEGIHSVLAVPLRIGQRYLGVLRVYTGEVHHFSGDEQLFVSAVADLIARLVRNQRLHQAIYQIAAEVNSSLEVKAVLQALLDNVVEQMMCKAASLRLLGPQKHRLHLVATKGLSEQYLQKGDIRVEESGIDRQVLQGEVVILYDVQQESGFQYPAEALAEGIRSVLAVPLAIRGQIIGVLRVYSAQPYRFNTDEVDFLRMASDLGAVALDKARLYEALSEKYESAREDWAGWYRFLALS